MTVRTTLVSILAATLATGTAERAAAGGGGGEAFVGGLIGSAIGTAIVNQQQQRRPVVVERRYVTRRAPAPVNTWQREQNRQVQTALNYFGFPAGVPDGVLGANSRSGIAQYQVGIRTVPTATPQKVTISVKPAMPSIGSRSASHSRSFQVAPSPIAVCR